MKEPSVETMKCEECIYWRKNPYSINSELGICYREPAKTSRENDDIACIYGDLGDVDIVKEAEMNKKWKIPITESQKDILKQAQMREKIEEEFKKPTMYGIEVSGKRYWSQEDVDKKAADILAILEEEK